MPAITTLIAFLNDDGVWEQRNEAVIWLIDMPFDAIGLDDDEEGAYLRSLGCNSMIMVADGENDDGSKTSYGVAEDMDDLATMCGVNSAWIHQAKQNVLAANKKK